MFVFQTNPVGVKHLYYVNAFFCSSYLACMAAGHGSEIALLVHM